MLLLELHFKVPGGQKESHTLAETTLFWHLYTTAHSLSLAHSDIKKCVRLQLHFKVSGEKKKVMHSGRNKAVLAFVPDCTSLTHPDTTIKKKNVGLQIFVSFQIVARVGLRTFAQLASERRSRYQPFSKSIVVLPPALFINVFLSRL